MFAKYTAVVFLLFLISACSSPPVLTETQLFEKANAVANLEIFYDGQIDEEKPNGLEQIDDAFIQAGLATEVYANSGRKQKQFVKSQRRMIVNRRYRHRLNIYPIFYDETVNLLYMELRSGASNKKLWSTKLSLTDRDGKTRFQQFYELGEISLQVLSDAGFIKRFR